MEDEGIRKTILHLTCCLLPKANRDSMEAICLFLRWVASFSHVDEETGSKMDLHNLATVITPNVLYSKSKDPIKDESFLAIEAVMGLLEYQDDFCVVSCLWRIVYTVKADKNNIGLGLIIFVAILLCRYVGSRGFVANSERSRFGRIVNGSVF